LGTAKGAVGPPLPFDTTLFTILGALFRVAVLAEHEALPQEATFIKVKLLMAGRAKVVRNISHQKSPS
jgi:hypothetical protein